MSTPLPLGLSTSLSGFQCLDPTPCVLTQFSGRRHLTGEARDLCDKGWEWGYDGEDV